MTLSIPHSFSPSTTIASAQVNANNTAISTWANGNIQNDNFGTMSGAVTWSISGTGGALIISSSGVLAASKAYLRVSSSSAEVSGDAGVYANLSSASSSIAAIKAEHAGTGAAIRADHSGTGHPIQAVSTKRGSIPSPKMTTAQRDAIASPTEGEQIFNTDNNVPEYYNGSQWESKPDLGQQISDSTGTSDLNITSNTYVDVTNLTVTLTTRGRPVMLALIAGGTTNQSYIVCPISSGNTSVYINFVRDSTEIATFYFQNFTVADGFIIPPPWHIDTPSAGTYTYKVQARETGASTLSFRNIRLCAFEL